MSSQRPLRLGPYRLDAPIGRGGSGEVWAATHTGSGVDVAIKVLAAEHARTTHYVQAFQREVGAIAALDHPNVVMVFDHGLVPAGVDQASEGRLCAGSPWLAMELMAGGTLKGWSPAPSWVEARRAIVAVLSALAHTHARGLLHLDLKPSNILLGEAGTSVALSDFGLAHEMAARRPELRISTSQAPHSLGAGTPAYMSPEQIRAEWRQWGPWTDLYGVGNVAWSLIAGSAPFAGRAYRDALAAALNATLPPLRPRFDVPEGLEGWLRRLLAHEPRDRFERAAHALRALEALEGEETPSVGWRRAYRPRLSAQLRDVGLGLLGRRSIPLVGREAERGVLWSALEAVRDDQRPRALILRGGTGVGKSALAGWLAERAHEEGLADVWSSTHSAQGGATDGIVAMVARALGCVELPDPEAQIALRVDDEALAPALAAVLTGAADVAASHGALLALARQHPLVMWFDDVPWGLAALDFAAFVLDETEAAPILVVMTAQDEAVAALPGAEARLAALAARSQVSTLRLGPLSEGDAASLLEGLLPLDPEVAEHVLSRTEGNPLFMVQLVQGWLDAGVLEAGPQGYRVPDHLVALPSLSSTWTQRLDGVLAGRPPADGVALELAATLGTVVVQPEWIAVCRLAGVRPSTRLLDVLERRGLLVPDPAGTWRFVHALFREAVLARASQAGRLRSHHASCAEMLAHGVNVVERLASHRVGAEQWSLAVPALLAAADARRGAGRFVQAHGILERLADVLDAVPEVATPRARAELVVRQASVQHHLGRRREAEASWRDALERARALGDVVLEVTSLYGLATTVSQQTGPPASREVFVEALARCDASDDPEVHAWRPRVQFALSNCLWVLGEVGEAQALMEDSLAGARALGRTRDVGDALRLLSVYARHRGEQDRALALATEAVSVQRATGSTRDQATSVAELARVHYSAGRYDQSLALHRQAQSLRTLAGLRAERNDGMCDIAAVELARGHLDRALHSYRAALVGYRAQGSRGGVAVAQANLGEVYRDMGFRADALKAMSEAIEVFDDLGSVRNGAIVRGNRGVLYQRLGRYDDARADLEAALVCFADLGEARHEAPLLAPLALLDAHRGELDLARARGERALDVLRAAGDDLELCRALALVGELRMELGEREAAAACLAEAEGLLTRLGVQSSSAVARGVERLRAALSRSG